MTDLKEVLMHLGNKLVTEHGYNPATGMPDDRVNSTHPIKSFTVWMNEHPEAQEVLNELGFKWSMPQKERR
jgi:hypothetical protein